MNAAIDKFTEIYERVAQDMPLFIKSGIESFISLFLFTLILFFIFLLLQCAKNLVFKDGKNLIPYGACLTALTFVFYFAFSPAPCIKVNAKDTIARVRVQAMQGSAEMGERYLFISERERLADMLLRLPMTRSVAPAKPANASESWFMLTVTYESGIQSQISVGQNNAYCMPVPSTGRVMRSVNFNEEISRYLFGLKI